MIRILPDITKANKIFFPQRVPLNTVSKHTFKILFYWIYKSVEKFWILDRIRPFETRIPIWLKKNRIRIKIPRIFNSAVQCTVLGIKIPAARQMRKIRSEFMVEGVQQAREALSLRSLHPAPLIFLRGAMSRRSKGSSGPQHSLFQIILFLTLSKVLIGWWISKV